MGKLPLNSSIVKLDLPPPPKKVWGGGCFFLMGQQSVDQS
jgi:hypothetical protein